MNKYYLETNLMAALPSSHLDSLYADLQVHALDVSDGLAKVQTTLGTDMLTTVMGRIDIDLTTAIRQQSTVSWLQTDATLKALLPQQADNEAQYKTAYECIAQLCVESLRDASNDCLQPGCKAFRQFDHQTSHLGD